MRETEGYGDDKKILEHIPYNIMSNYGWVPKTRKADQKVSYLREFFGVASLTLIQSSSNVMFRKQKVAYEISDYATLPPDEFFPRIVDLCAGCGVAVELVEYIPKTGICFPRNRPSAQTRQAPAHQL